MSPDHASFADLPSRARTRVPDQSEAQSAAVACAALWKSFGPVVAVEDVTLEVARGELLALLGPSGCGKTTFLRLLAGFERPDSGTISLGGLEVAGDRAFVPAERRRVGMVFQDYALFPHLTVSANVGYGLPRGERRSGTRVREVVALVGLTGLGERYPHELSGGQQQRVALARAIAPEPRIVLLDEPFSNLDAALRDRVRTEVREILLATGATTIVVTHDQEEALGLAHRVAVMRAGRLLQVDTPGVLYARPADPFVAAFVGGANVLDGSSDGHVVASPLGTLVPAQVPAPGPTLVVVRPESVRLYLDAAGQATVRRSTFYGHDQVVEVATRGGVLVRCRLGPGRSFEAGDRVRVTVAEDEVIAFPDERAVAPLREHDHQRGET